MSESGGYGSADVAHESDFDSPLHHGILRYVPTETLAMEIKNELPVKNDRRYVYVPAGFLNRIGEGKFISEILAALKLDLPNLVIVSADTIGSAEEQMEESYRVENAVDHPVAKEWTEDHTKEVLRAKVGQLLNAACESSAEVGAWIMPQSPRRRNGSAQLICEAMPPTSKSIALGLLGLDDRDEQDGFTESLRTSMVPLGSPIKLVSSVPYDPELRDGVPCPQLTHLLFFQSPHEMRLFRKALLDLVPDMLLAFGHITRDAMKSVFDNTVDGSPVFLIKHTGTNVDALCRMFTHVRKHLASKNKLSQQQQQQQPPATTAPAVDGTVEQPPADPTTTATTTPPTATATTTTPMKKLPTKIPPIEGEEDDLIRLFLNTWPPKFNSQTIVLADPLILSGTAFQKRILGAVTAAFDLKTGGPDSRNAKRRALDYAWSFYHIAKKHAKARKGSSESLHSQLVIFTLVSIVASVMYNQIYGGASKDSTKTIIQQTIYVATIILPLYITGLKQESDTNNPSVRWAAFEIAASQLESEIFQFRAQVGPYRAADKSEGAMQAPLQAFAKKTREIWEDVKQFLKDDGMHIPSDFWADGSPMSPDADTSSGPAAGGGPTAASSAAEGSTSGVASLPTNIPDETTQLLPTKTAAAAAAAAGLPEKFPIQQRSIAESKQAAESAADDMKARAMGSIPGSTTTAKKGLLARLFGLGSKVSPLPTSFPEMEGQEDDADDDDDDDQDDEDDIEKEYHNNNYSPMTAEEYIQCRMKHIMQIKADEIQRMVSRNSTLSRIIQLITVLSGATAALSLQWAVPIILGITAALGTAQEFRKYPRRIELGNGMVMKLNDLKLWWMGLSMYQRQLPHNKDALITSAEEAIVNEISGSFDAPAPKK